MEKTEIMFEFDSDSENESLARTVVAAFLARLDPTLEELGDVKTAVSEAVTNAIIHGYDGKPGKVKIHGTVVYDQTGNGTFRNGLCFHGSFHG